MNDPANTNPGRARPRRLRRSPAIRELVAETRLEPSRLIAPFFALPVERGTEPIESMPGHARLGREDLAAAVERALRSGINTILLFGLAEEGSKDPKASSSFDRAGAVPSAIDVLKERFGADVTVMTDVCLCAYTDHGHCGLLAGGVVDNDATLPVLARMALAHARAGADFVAPSDMMDGRVAAIREALDSDGYSEVGILSYAVKYASAYYGPFRDAAGSAPSSGDRKTYQMDVRNGAEAVREAALDEDEGADMLMVKPALAYLDVLRRVSERTTLPVAAYNVSGEYSAVKAAAGLGWLDEASVVRENLLAMRRAGADVIISYHAQDAVERGWL